MIKLKSLLEVIQDDVELENEISEYGKLTDEVEKKYKSIQSVLDEIGKIDNEAKTKYKEINKYMERFRKDEVKSGKWVALLEEKLKYKVVRPDYKELWNNALTKVNSATKKVLNELMNIQKEVKSKEMTNVFSITKNESVFSFLKNLWKRFTSLFKSIDVFSKTVNKLPKI